MLTSNQLIMLAIVAFISAFGGFVQWIRKEDAIRTSTELVKTISTGIFTGVLSFVALTTVEMDTMLRYVLAGLASYIGGSLLDMSAQVATKVAERKLGISSGQDDNGAQLDTIANMALQSGTKTQPRRPIAPTPPPPPVLSSSTSMSTTQQGDAPIQARPGEVLLSAYEAEASQLPDIELVEQPVEKPKRKRAPRKKKVEKTPPAPPQTSDGDVPAQS